MALLEPSSHFANGTSSRNKAKGIGSSYLRARVEELKPNVHARALSKAGRLHNDQPISPRSLDIPTSATI